MAIRISAIIGIPAYTFALACLWAASPPSRSEAPR